MERLSDVDFISGVLVGIRLRGYKALGFDPLIFARAFSEMMPKLTEEAEKHNVRVGLYIVPHFIHGNSRTVDDAMARLLGGWYTLDAPRCDVMRLNFGVDEGRCRLSRLPFSTDFWLNLADDFLRIYHGETVQTAQP